MAASDLIYSPPISPRLSALLISLATVFVVSVARADVPGENAGKHMAGARTKTPPLIDGRLDDAVWKDAPADDRFTQAFPEDGKPPSEHTEIRVLYDDDAIYVGLRMEDRHAGEIVARLTRRDRDVEADAVAIGIDSRLDHASAFVFQVNAAGVQKDVLVFNDTDATTDWDAVWDVEVTRDAGGWSAEFRIPLRVLRFSAARAQEWGFSVRRYITRLKEEDDWSHVPSDVNAMVSRWGRLTGLTGLKPKRSLELRPFAVARMRARSDSGGALFGLSAGADQEPAVDLGVDAKYGLTSNLTLDATVNPDFGQVEADQVVLNLSRFESFFPEKRPFFLEGTEIFTTPVQVFYSRRVGKPPSGLGPGDGLSAADGTPLVIRRAPVSLPIWTAMKLSGKLAGAATVGAFDAITGAEDFTVEDPGGQSSRVRRAPPRNYAVARAKYSLGGSSYVGLFASAVNRLDGELTRASANHDAYVESADAQFQSRSGRWRAVAQAIVSERAGGPSHRDGDGEGCDPRLMDPGCLPITRQDGTRMGPGAVGFGTQAEATYTGTHWTSDVFAQTFSPKLDVNDLGFLNQFNTNFVRWEPGWRDVKPHGIFQNRRVSVDVRTGGTYERVRTALGATAHANALFKNYWFANLNLGTSIPGNWDQFETGDGAYFRRIPGWNVSGYVETDGRKRVQLATDFFTYHDWYGGAYGGGFDSTVTAHPLSQLEADLTASLGWNENDVRNWFDGGCVDDLGAGCTVNTVARHYRFGMLDSGSLSFTMHGTYTFTPRLSVQAYAQVFMDRGSWKNRRVADVLGPRPFIHREMLHPDPSFTGDLDGDGKPDDAFQDTSLNLNAVLRWELLPGTTLLGVYTRASAAAYDLTGLTPRFRITGLSSGPTEEIFLIKLVYYLAPS